MRVVSVTYKILCVSSLCVRGMHAVSIAFGENHDIEARTQVKISVRHSSTLNRTCEVKFVPF